VIWKKRRNQEIEERRKNWRRVEAKKRRIRKRTTQIR
jgi:hypothetical protein